MKAGRNLIPASRMATTKGLADAFAALSKRAMISLEIAATGRFALPLVGAGQCGRVRGHKKTDDENSTNVKDEDTPEGTLDRSRNSFPGVSCLTD